MVEGIGSFGANVRRVGEDGGKRKLDSFLAKFLGTFFDAFVKEPGGVGSLRRRCAPFGDTAHQIRQHFEIIAGHFSAIQWSLTGIPFCAKCRLA